MLTRMGEVKHAVDKPWQRPHPQNDDGAGDGISSEKLLALAPQPKKMNIKADRLNVPRISLNTTANPLSLIVLE